MLIIHPSNHRVLDLGSPSGQAGRCRAFLASNYRRCCLGRRVAEDQSKCQKLIHGKGDTNGRIETVGCGCQGQYSFLCRFCSVMTVDNTDATAVCGFECRWSLKVGSRSSCCCIVVADSSAACSNVSVGGDEKSSGRTHLLIVFAIGGQHRGSVP